MLFFSLWPIFAGIGMNVVVFIKICDCIDINESLDSGFVLASYPERGAGPSQSQPLPERYHRRPAALLRAPQPLLPPPPCAR